MENITKSTKCQVVISREDLTNLQKTLEYYSAIMTAYSAPAFAKRLGELNSKVTILQKNSVDKILKIDL